MTRDERTRRMARVIHRGGIACPRCGGASPLFGDEADPDNCHCGGGRSSAWWQAQVFSARSRQRESWEVA